MRAACYSHQGPAPEVFTVGEQPTPEPGPGEVRVRLRWSGVNPSDWKTRKGGGGRKLMAPLIIPHSDGAGVIDAVGEGVQASRIGERVWIWNGQWKRPFGTAAQWIALPSAQAVKLPDGVDEEAGACLGIPAFTAMHAVRLAAPHPGTTVLVAGGAGSVGHYAIQMARARGATVIASTSSPAKAQHALAAGADHVFDYRSSDFAARVKAATGGAGVDAVIEVNLTANAAQYPGLLKAHGQVVVYGITGAEATLPALWLMQNSIALKFFMIYDIPPVDREAALRELDALLRAQRLRHTVALRLPLDRIAEAHDIVERGELMGHVLLEV
ncbi:MAG: NADPH:quinone reductase [Hydrogenophaga sp.]|uniref:NADPH:quinone reductase n=1 Tax=Hydrogenophaga sp. TaxID=1904254 RepID=UPI003D14B086